MLLPPWAAIASAGALATARAKPLSGHVVEARPFVGSKGRHMYRVAYVYSDEAGQVQSGQRELVDSWASDHGVTTDGAPVSVKVVWGEALLAGESGLYVVMPLMLMALCTFLALLFALIDGQDKRRLALALRGTLARAQVVAVSRRTRKGSVTLSVSYRFDSTAGAQTGKEGISASSSAALLPTLALERLPASGDAVWVAYEPQLPSKSTIYSFCQDEAFEVPATKLAPIPLALTSSTPRALPEGAPRLRTEVSASTALLLIFAALTTPVAFILSSLVGLAALSLLFILFAPTYLAVHQKQTLLRVGVPYAARVLHISRPSKTQLSISFEAETPRGNFRGQERLHQQRLGRMTAAPAVGDTMFLVCHPEHLWQRVVWGFERQ